MQTNRIKQIEDIYFKTYASKRALENYPQNFVDDVYKTGVNRYCSFLQENIKNPIVTTLIHKNILEEHPVENIQNYTKNLRTVEMDPKVTKLLTKLTAINMNYPNTQGIREKLISTGRLDLYRVTSKLSGFKKLMLKLKILF